MCQHVLLMKTYDLRFYRDALQAGGHADRTAMDFWCVR